MSLSLRLSPVQVQRAIERRRKEARRKEEKLLLRMLPASVAEALKEGRKVEPEHHPAVTILFTDIVGYTSLSSQLAPADVMGLLNRLYLSFDQMVLKHGLFKLEASEPGVSPCSTFS